MPTRWLSQNSFWKAVWSLFSRTTKYCSGFNRRLQSRIVRHRPIRIETGGLLFFLVRENKKVDGPGGEHSHNAEANVSAKCRSFLAGDSAADHDHEIESETRHRRHFFFSNKIFGKRRALQGSAGILSSVRRAVAAFEDLQAARPSLQIQGHFRSRARLAGNLVVLRRPPV